MPNPLDALISLLDAVRRNRTVYTVNEEATKQGVILPILARLGWDRENILEVAPEYSVGTGRVDYCLKRGDVASVFLEIKRLDEPLDQHQEQLLGYAFQLGVPLAALSDGMRWWLYLPTQAGSWEQRKFFTINLHEQESSQIAQHLQRFLGKTSVYDGSALRDAQALHASRAKEQEIRRAIPRAWQDLCADADARLIELLSEKVEGRCGHRPDPEDLEKFLVTLIGSEREPGPVTNQPAPRVRAIETQQNNQAWTFQKPVAFSFTGTRREVSTFKDVLLGLAQILSDREPQRFWEKVSQLQSSRGRRYYTSQHDSLQEPRQIGSTGIWVETCFSANAIRDRCHELLAAFGHAPDELRVELRASPS